MLTASIWAHIALGVLLALIFTLYYVNADGSWKVLFEAIIGIGGNAGAIFLLEKFIPLEDSSLKMYSLASCISSFLISTIVLMFIFSKIIKDKDQNKTIRMRDIMLGQSSYIKKYYELRSKEIEEKLSIPKLEEREKKIREREENLKEKEENVQSERKFVEEQTQQLLRDNKAKLVFNLPENRKVFLNQEYIDMIPDYLNEFFYCINEIRIIKESLIQYEGRQNRERFQSFCINVAVSIIIHLFGNNTRSVRVHFRYFDTKRNGYVKYIAVVGEKVTTDELTFIPYDSDNMIKQSYECRCALLKSNNIDHDYRGSNHRLWQDYLTYTFRELQIDDKPCLSFGISVGNFPLFKKYLYLINYFRIDTYLQEAMKQIDEAIDISRILYGED